MDSGFHGGLTLSQKAHPVSGVPGAQIKGRASLATASRALKRLERARLSPPLPKGALSTEAVDNSVDGKRRHTAIAPRYCIFITLIKK
jgi:hypothetical protein